MAKEKEEKQAADSREVRTVVVDEIDINESWLKPTNPTPAPVDIAPYRHNKTPAVNQTHSKARVRIHLCRKLKVMAGVPKRSKPREASQRLTALKKGIGNLALEGLQ